MSKNPTLRVIGWVVLLGLAAGLIACGLAYGFSQKWFVAWRTLPLTEPPVTAIRGATVETVDVEAGDRLLRFDINDPELGWQTVETPRSESDEGCERFLRTRAPSNAVEQRLVCRDYADGGITTLYILRMDGRIGYWSAGDSAYEVLLLFICPAVAAPVGMGVGLAVGLIRNRKRKEAAQP